MATTGCMGGWCRKRDTCRLYHSTGARIVAERLCEPGKSDSFEPVRIVREPGSWERKAPTALLAPPSWAEMLATAG